MEQKSQQTRAATSAARGADHKRPCAVGGDLTAPAGTAIRIAASQKAVAAKGRVEVMEAYYDPDGLPTKRKGLGAARVARAYDAKGNQVEEAYFNAEGEPTVREDLGAARIAWRYDSSGKRVEAALYGADGARIKRSVRAVKPSPTEV